MPSPACNKRLVSSHHRHQTRSNHYPALFIPASTAITHADTAMPTVQTTVPERIVVHPVVLLSAVDHYNRVASNTKRRVVGVLLGQWQGKTVNISNSFAGR